MAAIKTKLNSTPVMGKSKDLKYGVVKLKYSNQG